MLPANIELVDSISLKSGWLWVRFFICTFVTSFSDVFLDPNCLIVIPSPAGYVFESLSRLARKVTRLPGYNSCVQPIG
jgi:hypothetical protein